MAQHTDKPGKPHPDFPLYAHATRRWAKKVRGKTHFFGPWSDPDGALNRWLDEKDDLLAGRKPRTRRVATEPTVGDLCNAFMISKDNSLGTGELSPHSHRDYERVADALVEAFGKDRLLVDITPADFEDLRTGWAKRWGPVRLGNEINRARVLFKYAYDNGLLSAPMRFGEGFRRPSRKTLRLARAGKPVRMFAVLELRRVLKAATQPLKAMVLLGINCGFGNSDVGQLPLSAIHGEWLDFHRPKTGISRRCWLWPETVRALKAWLKERPAPQAEHAHLFFVTAKGGSWFKKTTDNPVSKATRKLLDGLKIKGRNFYALRHTFETVAGETKDQVAVDAVMGHVDETMAGLYREGISDARLRAVAEHVRHWLISS